jgi:hypothetical protein
LFSLCGHGLQIRAIRYETYPRHRAVKIAKVFDVPVDFLLGEGKHASYSNETIKRLEEIENLDNGTKKTLFDVIDTYLRDFKARKAYA